MANRIFLLKWLDNTLKKNIIDLYFLMIFTSFNGKYCLQKLFKNDCERSNLFEILNVNVKTSYALYQLKIIIIRNAII